MGDRPGPVLHPVRPPASPARGRPAASPHVAHRRLPLPVLLPGGAGMTGPVVKLPDFSGEYDLARLNQAMDVVLEAGNEASGRYALVHHHGWDAVEAVAYTQAAQHCFDNSIDPNQLPPEIVHTTTPELLLAALDAAATAPDAAPATAAATRPARAALRPVR